jgi:pimeloyl-ACP methyl ester carboxylesterase
MMTGADLRWLLIGAAMGALFALVLVVREPDRARRVHWALRFWLASAAGLALLGLAGTWLART